MQFLRRKETQFVVFIITVVVVFTYSRNEFQTFERSQAPWAAAFKHSTQSSQPSLYIQPPQSGGEYDYSETEVEKYCSRSQTFDQDPIPNIVHFIIVNSSDIPFVTFLSIKSALHTLRPSVLKIHHTASLNEENQWFKQLEPHVRLVYHDLETEFPRQVREKWRIEHMADAMRLDIIQKEGGIYFDTDVISLKPMHQLLYNERDLVLGYEGGNSRNGLGAGVIMARPNSTFVQRWIDSYVDFSVNEWAQHSVHKPRQLARVFPQEICTLSPQAFYWPLYTKSHIEFMHEEIDEKEARRFKRAVDQNGGAMFPNQLAYHMWNHLAVNYIRNLNPYRIFEQDTRFNILARRFLEPL